MAGPGVCFCLLVMVVGSILLLVGVGVCFYDCFGLVVWLAVGSLQVI